MSVKIISKLAAACLLILAFCGCGKNESQTPAPDAIARSCATYLGIIDSAKKHWAEQHGAGLNDTPTEDDLQPYFRHGMPKCRGGGTYTIGKVGELPQCSIAAHNDLFKSNMAAEQAPAP